MQRIILESAPEFLVLCMIAGLGYAALQYYKTKHPWSKGVNALLFSFRAILAFFLAFLLLGPIVKQISNLYEKPAYIILHDNSSSVAEVTDSTEDNRSILRINGQPGIRVALTRSGMVLSPDGGALARMLPPFRLGAGGRPEAVVGPGEEWGHERVLVEVAPEVEPTALAVLQDKQNVRVLQTGSPGAGPASPYRREKSDPVKPQAMPTDSLT